MSNNLDRTVELFNQIHSSSADLFRKPNDEGYWIVDTDEVDRVLKDIYNSLQNLTKENKERIQNIDYR